MKRSVKWLLVCFWLVILGIFLPHRPAAVLADTGHCGEIVGDVVWQPAGNVHKVTCNVTVVTGARLTIAAGTIVKFNASTRLVVNGELLVNGAQGSKVYFTSYRDDAIGGDTNQDGASTGARGDWDGIHFSDTSSANSHLQYASVRWAGNGWNHWAAINLSGASPTIQNSEMVENQYCALLADLYAHPALASNRYQYNDRNALCMGGGTLDVPTVWDVTNTVYYLMGNITVAMGQTLTLNPGVMVKSEGKQLTVNGALLVNGSATNRVYISSYRDDIVWGDSNGDGASFGQRGDWEGIHFSGTSGAASIINYATINHAGNGWNHWGAVVINGAAPTIQNSELSWNQYCSITADVYAAPKLTNNKYLSNDRNALCLKGGTIDANTTWNVTDVAYMLLGDVTVALNQTLTVNPGVMVKSEGQRLTINGALLVNGSATDRVSFSSYRDDTVWGDSNGDGATFGNPGDWEGIHISGTSGAASIINYANISHAGNGWNRWGAAVIWGAAPTIKNSELTWNDYCSITADIYAAPRLASNKYQNNDRNALCLYGGTIDANTIWNVTSVPYLLTGDIFVAVNKTLTVNPGVMVKSEGKRLGINGQLKVDGLSTNRVSFSSYRDDTVWGDSNGDGASFGNPGDWHGIHFTGPSSDASTITYASISHAGNDWNNWGAVALFDAAPTIQYTDITWNQHCAISGDVFAAPNLSNNHYLSNTRNALCLNGGTLSESSTWKKIDTAYYLVGDISVAVDKTLAVQAGVIVKSDHKFLKVNGALRALGTAANPVYFTSYRDDSIGGDSNGDQASTGAEEDWDGISFTDTSSDANSLLQYAFIRFGGNAWGNTGGVHLDSASPTLHYVQLTRNAHAGISAANSQPALTCVDLFANKEYGLYNNTPATTILATNLFWGDNTGPYHTTNLTGAGNKVTDGVVFQPWRAAKCVRPPLPKDVIFFPLLVR